MNHILVATDFSTDATHAVHYAAKLAKKTTAILSLFHSFELPMPVSEVSYLALSQQELEKELRNKIQKEAEEISNKYNIQVFTYVVYGNFLKKFIETAEKAKADILLVGMRGMGGIQRFIGSQALSLIKETTLPLIVVPEKAENKLPSKIAFACDFGDMDEKYVMTALRAFALQLGAGLDIVYVQQYAPLAELHKKESDRRFKKYLQDIEGTFHFIEGEKVVDSIDNFIIEQKSDMLAVVPHKYSIMERMFTSSHSKKLLLHSSIPLFVIPETRDTLPIYLISL